MEVFVFLQKEEKMVIECFGPKLHLPTYDLAVGAQINNVAFYQIIFDLYISLPSGIYFNFFNCSLAKTVVFIFVS